MEPRIRSTLARIVFGVSGSMLLAGTALALITRSVETVQFGVRWFLPVVGAAYAAVGLLVATRRPDNPLGWTLSFTGFLATGAWFLVSYAVLSIDRHSGRLPLTDFSSWTQGWFWVPMLGLIQATVLLYPNGRLLSRKWRIAMVFVVVAVSLFTFDVMIDPEQIDGLPPGTLNPYGISAATSETLEVIVGPIFLLAMILSLASIVVRYRRSRGEEREQMRWLAFSMWFLVSTIAAGSSGELFGLFGIDTGDRILSTLIIVSFAGIPVAAGMAILRYRLYDIELLINRAVVLGVIAAFITLVYVGLVAGIGAIVETRGGSNVALPIVATALVAVAFQPVRTRAHALANRFVYGKRSTPFEALAELSASAGAARSADELIAGLARLASESTAARQAVVWIRDDGHVRPGAAWPERGPMPEPLPIENELPPLPGASAVYPIMHHSELLGAVAVDVGTEKIPVDDDKLLSHLAVQAGLALRNIRDAVVLPEGEVTFLMTDVQGSTRLWEEHPEEMAVALSEHDSLMRRLVGSHDGVLIKSRGEGDSTFSVFTEPPQAVAAAVAIQKTFAAYPWPTPRPLRVRAALHTGIAELRDRDYYGQVVNRCARLRAIAEGGQTVLSSATFQAVEGSLPDGARVSDLGQQQLKDLDEPERVYQITPAG